MNTDHATIEIDHEEEIKQRFVFEGKQKMTLLAFIVLGILCLGATFFIDNNRFWTNYLHNAVFFLGMSFVATFVLSAFMLGYAGWHVVMKRVWEAFTLFLPIGLIMMLVVIAGLWMHGRHLYHWSMDGIADPTSPNYDKILAGKVPFLNKYWYTFGTLIIVGIWTFFAFRLRSLSLKEDAEGTRDYKLHQQMKKVAAIFLPIGAFTSAALIWQWVMSIDGHWYSTLYAWYATASWFVAMLALTILILIYLKSKGYYKAVTAEHLHDLGKYMFAFSVFWTYLWFSQFMLIWYGNNGEETVYYNTRRHEYTILYFGNLVLNFALPFLILMRNDTKRKYGSLGFTAVLVFFGHWWDYFYLIKPGARINAEHAHHGGGHGAEAGHGAADAHGHGADAAHGAANHAAEHGGDLAHAAGHAAEHGAEFAMGFTIPGLLEIGTFLGFLAFFLYFVFSRLEKAALIPKNDPYLEESLHHHV